MVECLLWVKEEILSQVKEFRYLRVLLMSKGRVGFDRKIGAVKWSLHCSVLGKREVS